MPAATDAVLASLPNLIAKIEAASTLDKTWVRYQTKEGVECYKRTDEGKPIYLGVTKVDCPAVMAFDAVLSDKYRMESDPSVENSTVVSRLDPRTTVDYLVYQDVMMIKGRDFVTVTHWKVLEDGSVIVATQSLPDEVASTLKPQDPVEVRGRIFYAGYRIKPVGEQCQVSYVISMEFSESIPPFLSNLILSNVPLEIGTIGKFVEPFKGQYQPVEIPRDALTPREVFNFV